MSTYHSQSTSISSIVTPSSQGFSASSSLSSPSSTDTTSSNNNSTPPNSSSLYLYTFLATLVLLLGVSAAIVFRSFILRRRHQRLIDEAIQNGTWVPPSFGPSGRRHNDIGEQPVIWEAWVGSDKNAEEDSTLKGKEVEAGWRSILPVSARYLNPPILPEPTPDANRANPLDPSPHSRAILPWRMYSNRYRYRRRTPTPTPTPVLPTPSPNINPSTTSLNFADPTAVPTVQLTVLIAMPIPPSIRKQLRQDDDEGAPVVEFGVLNVNINSDNARARDTNFEEPAI